MVSRVLPLFLVVVAVLLWAGLPVSAQQPGQQGDSHEGTVVSVSGDKLVMREKDGKAEHSHTLAPNAQITRDGQAAKLADLKPGMRIRVTTKQGDKTTAVRVEALEKNQEFEKRGTPPKP